MKRRPFRTSRDRTGAVTVHQLNHAHSSRAHTAYLESQIDINACFRNGFINGNSVDQPASRVSDELVPLYGKFMASGLPTMRLSVMLATGGFAAVFSAGSHSAWSVDSTRSATSGCRSCRCMRQARFGPAGRNGLLSCARSSRLLSRLGNALNRDKVRKD